MKTKSKGIINLKKREKLLHELKSKALDNTIRLNPDQVYAYLSVLEAEMVKSNVECRKSKDECNNSSVEVIRLYTKLHQKYDKDPKVKHLLSDNKILPNFLAFCANFSSDTTSKAAIAAAAATGLPPKVEPC